MLIERGGFVGCVTAGAAGHPHTFVEDLYRGRGYQDNNLQHRSLDVNRRDFLPA